MSKTIDKLDMSIYVQYARRVHLLEHVQPQYRVGDNVSAQASIVDVYPKLSGLDILLGSGALQRQWGFFFPPGTFATQRRSAFARHRVAPLFEESCEGESGAEKRCTELLDGIACSSSEEEKERQCLLECLLQLSSLNELLRFIGGRIGQFLQG